MAITTHRKYVCRSRLSDPPYQHPEMKLWQLKPPSTVWSTISVGEKLFTFTPPLSDVSLSDRYALGWIVIWKILTRCLEFYYDLNNFCMWEIGRVKFHCKCLSASPKPLVALGFYLPCIKFLCWIALLKTRCVEPGSLIKLQKSIYNKIISHRILFRLFIPVLLLLLLLLSSFPGTSCWIHPDF